VLPYGIDYQHDIKRLSEIFGLTVKTFFDVGANTGQTSSAALVNFLMPQYMHSSLTNLRSQL